MPSPILVSSNDQTTSTLAKPPSREPGPPLVAFGNQDAPGGQQNLSSISRTADEINFVLYENPSYGFSIQYPSDWVVRDRGVSGGNVFVEFFSPIETEGNTFVDNFNVGVQNLSGVISLDEYGQSVVSLLNSRPPGPDFKLTQQPTSTTLGGFPAQKIEYTMVLQNESAPVPRTALHGMQVWTINDDSIFVLSFVAEQNRFALYQPIIEHIIRTFTMAGP
jgi:serine/threonine-protein kinase